MKIFSLETKKHVLGWSLVLAIFISSIPAMLAFYGRLTLSCPRPESHIMINCDPVILPQNLLFDNSWMLGIVVFALVAYVVLSLIRYFRYKKAISGIQN